MTPACCMSISKERSIERSPRSGRNVENSPIAFSNSENLRPSNKTPTTGFDLPVNREIRICQHASMNDDGDTPSAMALIRAMPNTRELPFQIDQVSSGLVRVLS